jgi:hypothetical protein
VISDKEPVTLNVASEENQKFYCSRSEPEDALKKHFQIENIQINYSSCQMDYIFVSLVLTTGCLAQPASLKIDEHAFSSKDTKY